MTVSFSRGVRFLGQGVLPAVLTLAALGNTNCSKVGFGRAPSVDEQGKVDSLTAAPLNYATNVNVPLNILKKDVLAAVSAPAGDTLTLLSVDSAADGLQLSGGDGDADDHFVFLSSTARTESFRYYVSDGTGLKASNIITVKVLPTGNAVSSYYACGSGKLYELSANNQSILNTVNTTYLGQPLILEDLAINSNAELYGKDRDGNGIYRIDVNTGIGTQIVATIPGSSGYLLGLTFLPNGNLSTVQLDGTVLSFNIASKQTTILEKSNYTMAGGDIKMLPDGYTYWTVSNASSALCRNHTGPGTQALVRIDPKTGANVEIGCLDQSSIYGLGFAKGVVYGFTGAGSVVKIDTATAKATVVASPGFAFWGAASNPALW